MSKKNINDIKMKEEECQKRKEGITLIKMKAPSNNNNNNVGRKNMSFVKQQQ
jgi:hypothetical protein